MAVCSTGIRTRVFVLFAFCCVPVLFLAGCGVAGRSDDTTALTEASSGASLSSVTVATTTTTEVLWSSPSPADSGGVENSGYRGDGIPMPFVDGPYRYLGEGHFATDSGTEFFWRDGRFVNSDGSLLEVPDSVREALAAAGADDVSSQPTFVPPSDFDQSSLADLSLEDALHVMMYELRSRGWWLSHLYIESREPLALVLTASEADNAPGVASALLAEALRVHRRGLPMEALRIEVTGASGQVVVDSYDAEALARLEEELNVD